MNIDFFKTLIELCESADIIDFSQKLDDLKNKQANPANPDFNKIKDMKQRAEKKINDISIKNLSDLERGNDEKFDLNKDYYLEYMWLAYMEAAKFTEEDRFNDELSTGDEFIQHNDLEFSRETKQKMLDDCQKFIKEAGAWLDSVSPDQAGHDFWLTRNGHGAGFWDRGLGRIGDKLTAIAKSFGAVDLFVDDKKQISQS